MILNRFAFIIIVFSICLINPIAAQIYPDLTGVNANFFADTCTAYNNESVLGRDSIYIYYSKDDGYSNIALLRAKYKDSLDLNFRWYLYNENTHLYDSLLMEELHVASSSRKECTQGGYKVSISSNLSSWDTAFYCWVFQNEFNINNIRVRSSDCEQMQLQSFFNYDYTYTYYDRLSGDPIVFETTTKNLKFNWTSSVDDGVEIEPVSMPTFDAPTEPTIYTLTITDKLGKHKTKKIEINEGDHNGDENLYLKAVKAKFSASRSYVPVGESDSTGQAPLAVQFIDSSKNAIEYQWCFYRQGAKRSTKDSLLIKAIDTRIIPDSVIYTQPGDEKLSNGGDNKNSVLDGYDVALTVKGPLYMIGGDKFQCVDRLLREKYVKVTPTFVQDSSMPNVFTPGGAHPLFTFNKTDMPTSVKYFSVKIYNRWGNKIYEYEDNSGEWEGWDGETKGFGSAPTGVYFYVIIYDGWNGEKRSIRKGFVHLFRTK